MTDKNSFETVELLKPIELTPIEGIEVSKPVTEPEPIAESKPVAALITWPLSRLTDLDSVTSWNTSAKSAVVDIASSNMRRQSASLNIKIPLILLDQEILYLIYWQNNQSFKRTLCVIVL